VVAQVALSVVLLVGASLFVRTLINLEHVDTGFDGNAVVVLHIDDSAIGHREGEQNSRLMEAVEEHVRSVPGVTAASLSMFTYNEGVWSTKFFVDGDDSSHADGRRGLNNTVGPEFFKVMGIPLVLGRSFGPEDSVNAPKVAVINETMARQFFADGSPLGRRFGLGGPEKSKQIEVVGVVRDSKFESLDEETRPMAYYVNTQQSDFVGDLEARVVSDPGATGAAIRRAVREVDSRFAIDSVSTLAEQVDRSLVRERLVARLSTFFGLIALALACIGLYGILSYGVARRTNEIGIRVALGAQRGSVLWLVFREAAVLVLFGALVGVVAASASARAIESLLFGLTPTDPLAVGAAVMLLLVVAALAGWLPARRATRVDPMVALRDE
jgi:predicted permease